MNKNERISVGQFSCIIFLFLVGTSFIYVFELGIAGRDAWLANALASLAGTSLLWFIIKLSQIYPGLSFSECLEKTFGKIPGIIISFIYFLYCIYWCSLVLQNISEMLVTAAMPDMDRSIFALIFIVLIIYMIISGAEVMGRTSELFFTIFIFLAIILTILEIKELEWENVLPVMGEGIKPVIAAAWPAFSLPYGELFILAVLLPYVGKVNKKGKVWLMYGMASIMIVLGRLMPTLIFGAPLARRLVFPILETVRMIQVGRFIERIEAFLLLIWVLTAFAKAMVIFYSSFSLFCHTFRIKTENNLLIPIGILILALERISYESLTEASKFISYSWPIFSLIFRFIIPFVLLFVAIIRNRNKKQADNKAGAGNEAV